MSPSHRGGMPKGCSAKAASCTPARTHALHPDQLWKVVSFQPTLSRFLK